jgi:hypothetical protein
VTHIDHAGNQIGVDFIFYRSGLCPDTGCGVHSLGAASASHPADADATAASGRRREREGEDGALSPGMSPISASSASSDCHFDEEGVHEANAASDSCAATAPPATRGRMGRRASAPPCPTGVCGGDGGATYLGLQVRSAHVLPLGVSDCAVMTRPVPQTPGQLMALADKGFNLDTMLPATMLREATGSAGATSSHALPPPNGFVDQPLVRQWQFADAPPSFSAAMHQPPSPHAASLPVSNSMHPAMVPPLRPLQLSPLAAISAVPNHTYAAVRDTRDIAAGGSPSTADADAMAPGSGKHWADLGADAPATPMAGASAGGQAAEEGPDSTALRSVFARAMFPLPAVSFPLFCQLSDHRPMMACFEVGTDHRLHHRRAASTTVASGSHHAQPLA